MGTVRGGDPRPLQQDSQMVAHSTLPRMPLASTITPPLPSVGPAPKLTSFMPPLLPPPEMFGRCVGFWMAPTCFPAAAGAPLRSEIVDEVARKKKPLMFDLTRVLPCHASILIMVSNPVLS